MRQPSAALTALESSSQWLIGPSGGVQALQGKVVLVAFWTYSCINSIRVLPYLRAWQAKYGNAGLAVVGVHTPEFEFEKDPANVRRAIVELGVDFPVALDSQWRIWRAFDNDAWPAFYFVGVDGEVHGRSVGEGGYDRSERLLQKLLAQTLGAKVPGGVSVVSGVGPQAAPDFANLLSNETYIGYSKANGFASPGGLVRDAQQVYRPAARLALDRWSLVGPWSIGEEFATLGGAPGRIAFRFHARDLHMVLGPGSDGGPVRFRVRIDGEPPGGNHGWDVGSDGGGSVQTPRMYQLVRQQQAIADRNFEIEFLDPGVRAFVFTFG